MRKSLFKFLLIGLAAGVGSLPAIGQTTINLTSSGSDLVTFAGNGSGGVTATLGECTNSTCSLSGATSGSLNGAAVTGYTLSIGQALPLTAGSNGSYSVGASSLTGSTLTLTGGGGNAFTGSLGSLTFTDMPSSHQALISATVNGSGSSSGTTVDLSGVVQLDGATIAAVQSSGYPTAISGGIVPEPTTLLLFGTGLIGLGALMRRRWEPEV